MVCDKHACPLCGGGSKVLTNKLRVGSGVVYYCEECDYAYLDASFASEKKFYNEQYRKEFKSSLNLNREESPKELFEAMCDYQNDRIRIMENYFDDNKSFLEIGCSAGQFINKIIGKFHTVEGIELSENCAEYVKKQWNINVFTDSLGKCITSNTITREKYDYVAFFQVLEHIDNPVQFMKDVGSITKQNGKVFIEVPNLYDPLLALWSVPEYERFYFHKAHLSYFSEKSLKILLEKTGWIVNEVFYIQDYNLLNHLYWYFCNQPQIMFKMGLDKPHIDFKNEHSDNSKIAKEINSFILKVNEEYFNILERNKMTSNIFVIAQRKKSSI